MVINAATIVTMHITSSIQCLIRPMALRLWAQLAERTRRTIERGFKVSRILHSITQFTP
jgi:hypothetical protein